MGFLGDLIADVLEIPEKLIEASVKIPAKALNTLVKLPDTLTDAIEDTMKD